MTHQQQKSAARHARMAKKIQRANSPRRLCVSKQEFLNALVGSAGLKTEIAKNLDVDRSTIARLLARPDWADVRDAYVSEIENAIDRAERRVLELIEQDDDPHVAGVNARWLLGKRRSEQYGDESTINLRGTILHAHAAVPAEALNLPPDILYQIAQAAEAYAKGQAELVEQRALPAPGEVGDKLTEAEL